MILKKLTLLFFLLVISGFCISHYAYALNQSVSDYLFQKEHDDFSASHLEKYYIDMALKYYVDSDYENALKNFNTALSFNKNNPVPWQYIGMINFHKGMYNDSMYMLKKSLELYPGSFGSNFYMGRIFEKLHKTDEALIYYKEAVRINPRNKDAYLRIFELYRDNLQPTSIIKYGKSALNFKQHPEVAACIYMWIGYAYIYLGDYDLAVTNLLHSKRLNQINTPDYLWVSGLIDVIRARRIYRYNNDKKSLDEIDGVLAQLLVVKKARSK